MAKRKCLVCILQPTIQCCKCTVGYCTAHLHKLNILRNNENETYARKSVAGECKNKGSWDTPIHCFCASVRGTKSITSILSEWK